MWLDPQMVEENVYDINHLEALNVVVALPTFICDSDHGGHIHVLCDDQAAMHFLTTGRGHDPRLISAAHSAWMLQAMRQVKVSIHPVPGIENHFTDALCRAPISNSHKAIAKKACTDRNLSYVQPCLYVYQQHDFSHLQTPDIQCATCSSGRTATRSKAIKIMGQLPGSHHNHRGYNTHQAEVGEKYAGKSSAKAPHPFPSPGSTAVPSHSIQK